MKKFDDDFYSLFALAFIWFLLIVSMLSKAQ